jgi:hypothetical protein
MVPVPALVGSQRGLQCSSGKVEAELPKSKKKLREPEKHQSSLGAGQSRASVIKQEFVAFSGMNSLMGIVSSN